MDKVGRTGNRSNTSKQYAVSSGQTSNQDGDTLLVCEHTNVSCKVTISKGKISLLTTKNRRES